FFPFSILRLTLLSVLCALPPCARGLNSLEKNERGSRRLLFTASCLLLALSDYGLPTTDLWVLLPLNRPRRLAADVVHHARHPRHLIHNPRGHPSQYIPRQPHPVRCHGVVRLHHPHRHRQSIRPEIPHHAHASHRQQHGKRLPHLLVQTRAPDLLDHNRIRLAQRVQVLLRNRAQQPHPESWSRERMLHQNLFRQPQISPDLPHFVLEQISQRFHQRKRHVLRQSAHIVVRLDRRRRPLHGHRLNHVRIQRPLHQ